MTDDTTIQRWITHPGPIQLRHAHRQPVNDLRAAEGLILGLLIGVNAWVWTYVVWRAFA